jgi:phosphopantetheine adenylyltransferase
MVDKDRDGIPDNVDADGGTGTNKPSTPSADAQEAARLAKIREDYKKQYGYYPDEYTGTRGGPTDTGSTSSKTNVTRLTFNSAKAMLQDAMKEVGFVGQLSKADIEDFMKRFEKNQNEQIEKIVESSRTKVVPGATEEALKKVFESTARQEFPSFFKPLEFAKDFIFTKIDFRNEAKLGAKNLDALAQVRGIVDKFQLLGVSDADIRVAAKAIARGAKTIADYTVELQQIAKKEYPQFADRFNMDPTMTLADIASPVVKLLAKTWQKTEAEVKNHPLVRSWINYPGPDGKGKQPSFYDIDLKAKNDPQYELTQEANDNARDAAVGLARAFGFGV